METGSLNVVQVVLLALVGDFPLQGGISSLIHTEPRQNALLCSMEVKLQTVISLILPKRIKLW